MPDSMRIPLEGTRARGDEGTLAALAPEPKPADASGPLPLLLRALVPSWPRALLLAVALAFGTSAFAIDPMPFADRAQEVRYQNLLRELRCLQCQNQTLADSDADIARQLRNEVFRMIGEGKSDDEIKDFMTARYGEFVLYRPKVESGTWLLWFGPFVILAGGALALVLHLRKRRTGATAPAATAARDEEDW